MKKIILITLTIITVLTLSACNNRIAKIASKPVTRVRFIHDAPESYNVNLQTLDYLEYLSFNNPIVTVKIDQLGEIKIQLFPEVAPNTVNSFIKYIQDEAYTSNEFHRVVTGFMIQAGRLVDPSCTIQGEMANNEISNDLSHVKGVVSMARLGGNYDSGSSQFFIVAAAALFLDNEYAGFGGVVDGFYIVDYLASLQSEYSESPVVPIIIESITVDLRGYTPQVPICVE
ncbi:peptidylprolyl isomerase [Candidatus Izimaplasma bacterium]|nr:peptidylprolyl isomerase [Candidatus Izimaplasma bacterium]